MFKEKTLATLTINTRYNNQVERLLPEKNCKNTVSR